jgi:hypothetical protein
MAIIKEIPYTSVKKITGWIAPMEEVELRLIGIGFRFSKAY